MTTFDFSHFTHLTFDCYGTLIDWEMGILTALEPILARHGVEAKQDRILQLYAKSEPEQEAGPYKPYRRVLESVLAAIGKELGFTPTPAELSAFSSSVGSWPPFEDTTESLRHLHKRYKLVIISNVDDDLFAETQKVLGVAFDEIITAQQAGSYKPSKGVFEMALQRLKTPCDRILHVAQSLYHDHAPAKEMGFTTVWVNRPSLLPGTGLALSSNACPDMEVDSIYTLRTLIDENLSVHEKN